MQTDKTILANRNVNIEHHGNDIYLEQAPALIIHPSFCCPVVMQPTEPLVLYILGTKVLLLDYFPDPIETEYNIHWDNLPNEAGNWIKGRINRLLQISPWDKVKQNAKTYKKPSPNRRLWFNSLKEQNENIKCTFLSVLADSSFLKDAHGNIIGKIRQATKDYYATQGYQYLFRIEIKNHKLAANKLYDLYWLKLDELAYHDNINNPENPISPFEDAQDTIIRQVLKQYGCSQKTTFNLNNKAEETNFFEPDENNPIQSYHPVYITNKQQLKIGHISDIHISSRHFAFKNEKVKAQLVNEHTETISELVHDSFSSTQELIKQMQKNHVDVLVITGDIHDYSYNLDVKKINISNTGNLWAQNDFENLAKERFSETYLPGIDNAIVYSLIKDYYDQYGKPIYIISGNHDSYRMPYGISPRIGEFRVNAGVPADHNLTIAEAILLYGPGYKDIMQKINFNPQVSNWFYHIYTPLSDFVIGCHNRKLIGLEWGDGEAFIFEPNHLPASTTSLNNDQIAIIKSATGRNQQCLLFTHYTLINYDNKYPLKTRSLGKIECERLDKYGEGSFCENREFLSYEYIGDNKNYLISGHSHRSGFYTLAEIDSGDMGINSYPLDEISKPKIKVGSKTRVIVTGSGGPIPSQNICGEMREFGLDKPTATIIEFKGEMEEITQIRADIKTANPRFAVALDYYDLIGPGIFKHKKLVSCEDNKCVFTAELNPPLFGIVYFAKEVTFYNFTKDRFEKVNGQIELDITLGKVILKIDPNNFWCLFKRKPSIADVIFAVIRFNGQELKKYVGFTQYNYDSPWVIRVQLKRHFLGGYTITRHSRHGEVPDLYWYRNQFPYEYYHKGKLSKW